MLSRILSSLLLGVVFLSASADMAPRALAADKRTPPPELSGLAGPEAEAFYLGANAIIWGYPAVMFEQLMRGRTSPDIVAKGNPQAAVNQFGLVRDLRGPEFKQIATPNNDTIYAQSFVDVSREPIVLSVPAVAAPRYYTFQLWDPNGDTFGYIGSRTTGREAGHFAFVGPNWQGDLPEGVTRIDTPYNGMVIWGRIGVDGPEDLQNALDIQDALRLTPLSLFGTSEAQLPPDLAFSDARVAFDASGIPEDLILYAELANSLRHTPPKPQDAVVAATLPQIGFSADGTVFDPSTLTDAQRSGLAKGAQFALHLMDVSSQTAGVGVNGWRWSPKSGIMGNDYLFRAAFAKWYTGGNAPSEAIYMDARTDNTGAPLDGSKRYVVRFEKGAGAQGGCLLVDLDVSHRRWLLRRQSDQALFDRRSHQGSDPRGRRFADHLHPARRSLKGPKHRPTGCRRPPMAST